MDPKIWGPHAWFFLHSITLAYPDNPSMYEKEDIKAFFNTLNKVLPCEVCREHFASHISQNPLTESVLQSKKTLINWLINIHNEVNKMQNKPQMTYDDVIALYHGHYSPSYILIKVIVICLIVSITLITLYYVITSMRS